MKVLLFARSVEEAAVIVPEPPREIAVPFTVRDELASMAFVTALLAIPNVPDVPFMKLPRVPEYVRTEPIEGVLVATLAIVFTPVA